MVVSPGAGWYFQARTAEAQPFSEARLGHGGVDHSGVSVRLPHEPRPGFLAATNLRTPRGAAVSQLWADLRGKTQPKAHRASALPAAGQFCRRDRSHQGGGQSRSGTARQKCQLPLCVAWLSWAWLSRACASAWAWACLLCAWGSTCWLHRSGVSKRWTQLPSNVSFIACNSLFRVEVFSVALLLQAWRGTESRKCKGEF